MQPMRKIPESEYIDKLNHKIYNAVIKEVKFNRAGKDYDVSVCLNIIENDCADDDCEYFYNLNLETGLPNFLTQNQRKIVNLYITECKLSYFFDLYNVKSLSELTGLETKILKIGKDDVFFYNSSKESFFTDGEVEDVFKPCYTYKGTCRNKYREIIPNNKSTIEIRNKQPIQIIDKKVYYDGVLAE